MWHLAAFVQRCGQRCNMWFAGVETTPIEQLLYLVLVRKSQKQGTWMLYGAAFYYCERHIASLISSRLNVLHSIDTRYVILCASVVGLLGLSLHNIHDNHVLNG